MSQSVLRVSQAGLFRRGLPLLVALGLATQCSSGVLSLSEVQKEVVDRGEPIAFSGEVITLQLENEGDVCVEGGQDVERVDCLQVSTTVEWDKARGGAARASSNDTPPCCGSGATAVRITYVLKSKARTAQGFVFRKDNPRKKRVMFTVDIPANTHESGNGGTAGNAGVSGAGNGGVAGDGAGRGNGIGGNRAGGGALGQ